MALETLDSTQWEYFSKHLLDDYDFIERYEGSLHVERDGITHALLVLNAKTGEGILVNSEGSAYARYSAYLPFAKPHLDYEIARIADYCVTEGTGNTSDGVWAVSFDEIYHHYDIDITKNSELAGLLSEELESREEIDAVVVTEDGLELTCGLTFCPQVEEPEFSLRSLLGFGLKDVTFIEKGSDRAISLSSEISERMITPAGKKEWADVLSAKVERIYVENGKGYIELSGCDMDRLGDFAYVYDGYGDEISQREWFQDPDAPMTPSADDYEKIDAEEFELRYAKHVLWLNDIPGGEQADFSGCYMHGLNLANRKLLSANFHDAMLENCNLRGTELCFADFSEARLEGCEMQYISGDEINMRNAVLNNCDLSFTTLYHGNFANALFYRCELFNGNYHNSCFENTRFEHTDTNDMRVSLDDAMSDAEWVESNYGKEQEIQ